MKLVQNYQLHSQMLSPQDLNKQMFFYNLEIECQLFAYIYLIGLNALLKVPYFQCIQLHFQV
jgi:hypothetical protein